MTDPIERYLRRPTPRKAHATAQRLEGVLDWLIGVAVILGGVWLVTR